MLALKDDEFKYIQRRNPGYNAIVCSLPSKFDESFEDDFHNLIHRYLSNLIKLHEKSSRDFEQLTYLCCLLNDLDREGYIHTS